MRKLMSSTLATALLSCLLAMTGCDSKDLDSFVSDVENQVSEVAGTTPDEAAVGTAPATEGDPASNVIVPVVPQVAPEDLVRQLVTTAPGLIKGGMIQAVADVPEAAAQITELDLSGAQLSAEDLAPLAKMKNIQTLNLTGLTPAASAFNFVGELPVLSTLNLQRTQADDSVLAVIKQSPHIRSLNLSGTQLTGAGLQHLAGLQELQELNLEGTRVADDSFAALSSVPIHTLIVRNTAVGDDGLAVIAKIPTLRSLDVSRTRISGVGCKVLARTQLTSLNACQTNFGVEGLVSIKGIRTLEELVLFQARIIEHPKANVFRGFPELKNLNLGGNNISDQGMHVLLKGLKSLERLEMATINGITNQGLEALITCKNLQHVDMAGTNVTPAAMADLRAASRGESRELADLSVRRAPRGEPSVGRFKGRRARGEPSVGRFKRSPRREGRAERWQI